MTNGTIARTPAMISVQGVSRYQLGVSLALVASWAAFRRSDNIAGIQGGSQVERE